MSQESNLLCDEWPRPRGTVNLVWLRKPFSGEIIDLVDWCRSLALITPKICGFSAYDSILPGSANSGGESRIIIFSLSNQRGVASERTAQLQETPLFLVDIVVSEIRVLFGLESAPRVLLEPQKTQS